MLVQACMQTAGLYSNKRRTNLLHFNLINYTRWKCGLDTRIGTSGLWDSGLANRASVLPRKPLLYAMHMIAVATAQLPSFLVCFKLFLKIEMESMATHQVPSRGAGSEEGKEKEKGHTWQMLHLLSISVQKWLGLKAEYLTILRLWMISSSRSPVLTYPIRSSRSSNSCQVK